MVAEPPKNREAVVSQGRSSGVVSTKSTTNPAERDDPNRLRERDVAPKAHGGGATENREAVVRQGRSSGVVSTKNTTNPAERDDPNRLLERGLAPKTHGGGATKKTAKQSSAKDEAAVS